MLIPEAVRSAMARASTNLRRARKKGATVADPVSADVYRLVLASGPCVYCGEPPEHVDHIRPLSRDGWEHESNLVPACEHCNLSKREKLLSEWTPDKVHHGVMNSVKVAIEYARQTGAELVMK
ncbi:HNH endonuclease [Streptomyces sp. DSM 116496]|uniref:HNH endonuclease n=1 Tax=Streptomyces stoeckheimensis TaxID=3344656 RepID=UPI0038B3458B